MYAVSDEGYPPLSRMQFPSPFPEPSPEPYPEPYPKPYPSVDLDQFADPVFPDTGVTVPDTGATVPVIVGVLSLIALVGLGCIAHRYGARASALESSRANGDAAAGDAAALSDAALYLPPSDQLQPQPRHRVADPPPAFSIASLTTFEAAPVQRGKPCSICLDPFGTRPLVAGACAHVFHAECVEQWLARDPGRTCPVCRMPLTGPQTRPGPGTPPTLPVPYAPAGSGRR